MRFASEDPMYSLEPETMVVACAQSQSPIPTQVYCLLEAPAASTTYLPTLPTVLHKPTLDQFQEVPTNRATLISSVAA